MNRINIAVSSCLLGNPVRHNLRDKSDPYIKETLSSFFNLVCFCPEVEAGMGVPREAVVLKGSVKRPKMYKINSTEEITSEVLDWSKKGLEKIKECSGVIFKGKSPSCGLNDVKVYNKRNHIKNYRGVGLFTLEVIKSYPLISCTSEMKLREREPREKFIRSVYIIDSWNNKESVEGFHNDNYYTLLSYGKRFLNSFSRNIENRGIYKKTLIKILGKLPDVMDHYHVLKKISHKLEDKLNNREIYELHHNIECYRRGEVILLEPITLIKHYVNRFGLSELYKQTYLNIPSDEKLLLNRV